jgi:hypothetical protein
LKRLASGANPAELQLGHDVSAEASTTLLSQLDAHWYALPLKNGAGGESPTGLELCAGGLGAAYFRVSGKTFNSKDLIGHLSYQGTQHLATLGALTDYDRNKDEAERAWAWERWQGNYEWTAAMLHRPAVGQYRWHLDQLVIVRDDERLRCGHVMHVALDSRDELTLGIKLWPGAPTAIAVRALTTMLVEEAPIPTVILGATPDEKPAMLLPPRTFNAGRIFRTPSSCWLPPDSLCSAADRELPLTKSSPSSRPASGRSRRHAQSSGGRNQPPSAAAREQSGRLVSVWAKKARPGARAGNAADPAVDRRYSARHCANGHESFEDRRRGADERPLSTLVDASG